MSSLTTPTQHCTRSCKFNECIRLEKEIKGIYLEEQEKKTNFIANRHDYSCRKSQIIYKKLLDLMSEFSKVSGLKVI